MAGSIFHGLNNRKCPAPPVGDRDPPPPPSQPAGVRPGDAAGGVGAGVGLDGHDGVVAADDPLLYSVWKCAKRDR